MAKYKMLDSITDNHKYQVPNPEKEGGTIDVYDQQKFAEGQVVTAGNPPLDKARLDKIVGYGLAEKIG